jgi:hypothetical protein
MAMISNPDVKLSRYRIMMATAAAKITRMKVAAAPTSTASGVTNMEDEDESRPVGSQTSGSFGQGTQRPPGRTGSSLRMEAVELPAPERRKEVLLPTPEEGMWVPLLEMLESLLERIKLLFKPEPVLG